MQAGGNIGALRTVSVGHLAPSAGALAFASAWADTIRSVIPTTINAEVVAVLSIKLPLVFRNATHCNAHKFMGSAFALPIGSLFAISFIEVFYKELVV
jgi:hypothetical protein